MRTLVDGNDLLPQLWVDGSRHSASRLTSEGRIVCLAVRMCRQTGKHSMCREESIMHFQQPLRSGADLGHGHDVRRILSYQRGQGAAVYRFPLQSITPYNQHESLGICFADCLN